MDFQTKIGYTFIGLSFVMLIALMIYMINKDNQPYEPNVFIYPYEGREYLIIDGEGGAYIMLHTPADSVEK